METSFSFRQVFAIFFGFGYLVNHRSKEIHVISNKHKNCHLDIISDKNSEYVTKKKALKLISDSEYNGCRWCFKTKDKK